MRDLIERLIDECESQDHHHERLSWGLVSDCIAHGVDGVGLLTIAIAVANMGVSMPDPVHLLDGTVLRLPLVDPVGTDWAGVGAHSGKHLLDHEQGGWGIAHADGDSLRQVYEKWGGPWRQYTIPSWAYNFNAILKSEDRDMWLKWAKKLLSRREVLVWSINWWIQKYWNHRLVVTATTLGERVVRARIANSRQGWLRHMEPGMSAQVACVEYVARKMAEGLRHGGKPGRARSRKRSQRQAENCLRVVELAGGEV